MKNSLEKYRYFNGWGRLVQICIVAFCFVSCFVILFTYDASHYYTFLVFLPFGYTIIIILAGRVFIDIEKDIIRFIIIGVYTVRNAVTPMMIALGNYRILGVYVKDKASINKSIALMLYETTVIFTVIHLSISKDRKDATGQTFKQYKLYSSSLFRIATRVITCAMIGILIVFPDVLSAYRSLWTADVMELLGSFNTISDYTAGSLERILYAFFTNFFSVMQMIWSVYLIHGINKRIGDSTVGVILSFVIIGLNTLFVGESNGYTIFVLVILVSLLFRLYPRHRTAIIFVCGGGIAVVLFLLSIFRINTGNTITGNIWAQIATFLNAYFPGVANFSVIWHMNVPSKGVTLYYDIYNATPFQSLTTPSFSGQRLAYYFNRAGHTAGQIVPFAGQLFYYFNFLGIFIQALVVYLALRWGKKAKKTDNYIKCLAYLTGAVIYSAGSVMYNSTIILSFTFKTIIPFFILAFMTDIRIRIYN